MTINQVLDTDTIQISVYKLKTFGHAKLGNVGSALLQQQAIDALSVTGGVNNAVFRYSSFRLEVKQLGFIQQISEKQVTGRI